MSDFEELDPAIHDQLRNVPPASSSVRDAHIAAALGEMSPAVRRTPGRLRILTGVAAAAVVALGGAAFIAQQDDASRPDLNGTVTTLPPKTGTDCAPSYLGAVGDVKYLTHNGTEFELWFQDFGIIDVNYNEQPCTNYGTINYWRAMVDRDLETSVPNNTAVCSYATEPIARFTDSRYKGEYKFILVQTATGLSLYFEDRCDTPIATLELP